MDPDKTLAELRELIHRNVDGSYSERISELFMALDSWLASGGFLPRDWSKR